MKIRDAVVASSIGLALTASVFGQPAAPSGHFLDQIVDNFQTAAGRWESGITVAALRLFYLLVLLDVVWTGIGMALKGAGIQDFFSECVRRVIFIGFFLALLLNGHEWAVDIVNSFQRLGSSEVTQTFGAQNVVGLLSVNGDLKPSAVAETGIQMAFAITNSAPSIFTSPGAAMFYGWAGTLVLIGFGAVAVRQVLILAEMYITLSGGVIVLGFGASRWSKDYALSYLKYSVSVGIKLMFVQLTVALCVSFINSLGIANKTLALGEVAAVLISFIVLAAVAWAVPSMVAGLLQGQSLGDGSEAVRAGQTAAAVVAGPVGAAASGVKSGLVTALKSASSTGKMGGRAAGAVAKAVGGLSNGMSRPLGAAFAGRFSTNASPASKGTNGGGKSA